METRPEIDHNRIGIIGQSTGGTGLHVSWDVCFDDNDHVRRGNAGRRLSKRTLHVLATVGLAEFAQRSAHQLSGGQQQRLSLARALVCTENLKRG